MMLSILASAALFAVPDPAWKDNIDREGWLEISNVPSTVLMVNRSDAPSTFWLRSEQETRSVMILMRYDCAAWTLQIAQSFTYAEPNMRGVADASSTPSAADVPPPNSLLHTLLTTVCEA